MLKRIALPSGIDRTGTSFSASDSWFDVNNMRFRGGFPQTIGGWSRLNVNSLEFILEGVGRTCFGARGDGGYKLRYVATNQKLYAIGSSKVADITPNKKPVVTLAIGALQTTIGSYVTITDAGISGTVSPGDWVVLKGFTSDTGGISKDVWNRDEGFQVLTVPTPTTFTIYPVTAPSGGLSTEAIQVYYKVPSGANSPETGSGWGVGFWGGDDYTADEFDLVNGPVDTTSGSASIEVEIIPGPDDPDPTIVVNDQLYLKGLTGDIGGLSTDAMNNLWWKVTSVASAPKLVLEPVGGDSPFSPVASSPGTGGGGNDGTYYRMLASGAVDGATRGWSTPSVDSTVTGDIRHTYIDNYGDDILFANDGGPIYWWDTSANSSSGIPDGSPDKVARSLVDFGGASNAPVVVSSFLISKNDGCCVAFGCNDIGTTSVDDINPILVRWSDQDNPFDWTPTKFNTSGGQMLRSGSKIIGGVSTKDEVIIFTDSAVYSMRFLGIEPWFSFSLITNGVELLTGKAAINASNAVFFMGHDGFYAYTGSVSPLSSTVSKYVFDDFNYDMKEKVFAGVNSGFSEVTWFYPSKGSFEPDRYVTLNYDENVWSFGHLDMTELPEVSSDDPDASGPDEYGRGAGDVTTCFSRTAWDDSTVFDNPMASYITTYNSSNLPADRKWAAGVTEQSTIMLHEDGTQAQGDALVAHVESGDISISDGNYVAFYSRVIPDIRAYDVTSGETPTLSFSLIGKDYPGSASTTELVKEIVVSPDSAGDPCEFSFTPTGNDSGVRGRGRSVRLKVSGSSSGYGWRVGDFRIDIQPDGKR